MVHANIYQFPAVTVGCKRVLFDAGYLQALHQPNVDIRQNAIARICPEGIVTTEGLHIVATLGCEIVHAHLT